MKVNGIYRLVFNTDDFSKTSILSDMGLERQGDTYRMLNGSLIEFRNGSPGLVEVHWASDYTDEFIDNNIKHIFGPYVFDDVQIAETKSNTFTQKNRVNQQISIEDDTRICGIAHVAIYTLDQTATIEKFKQRGFLISDSIENRSVFLRSKNDNPHHQILVIKSTEKMGIQHVALNAKDVYNVITKGLSLSSKGHKTLLGPGRHVISSSTHWYFDTPIGMFEISADEDYLTSEWIPKVYNPETSLIYEWAIEDGLNPATRRQFKTESVTSSIEQKLK